ncbi:hypothetical protein LG330_18060 [Jeotgalibacillus malaysiensis]
MNRTPNHHLINVVEQNNEGYKAEPENAAEQHLFDTDGSVMIVSDTAIPFTKHHT